MSAPCASAHTYNPAPPSFQIQQAIAIVAASSEEGVHRLIKQEDMCVFWRKNFKMLPLVEWKLFWAAFPSELTDNPMSAEQVCMGNQSVLI